MPFESASTRHPFVCAPLLLALVTWMAPVRGQSVPHGQDRPPGPALSIEEARKAMTIPEGFQVEVFAAEPEIVNPVSMTFDEKGRIWITESLEYPRREAGPGRDRVKILEDTDGDGKADRFTIFAEGLNIPCGIAVGADGVFVTNSPDILFLRDTDGDDKADQSEVVLTGFGRHDTHELPNTLTWGPDGWLYGLNGVFNPATVKQKGKEHHFDAALWRYHPRTRDFDLFAEGTSNPWGLAFDASGSAFVSACVIDHLYHLAESGYYHRQAGAYPPFTWKIESIVDHNHQKAAYCGLALYDADVYPEKYRDRLFMGNIHGNCINVDELTRAGSSYLAKGEPDFLSANDAWFMPVSIKLGPDGCFYVLDWYDRYHCYQDANRDPKGIDRLKGRLYRIAYGTAPRAGKFDLEAEASEKLIERLSSPNLWWRDESRRLLAERIAAGKDRDGAAVAALKALILDEKAARKARIQALWTLVSAEDPGSAPKSIDRDFHLKLLSLEDPTLRAWGIRAAGSSRAVDAAVRARVSELGRDPSPDVRLQAATAARKLLGEPEAVGLLLDVLAASGDDVLLPRIVWRNLEPFLETEGPRLAAWLQGQDAGAGARAIEPVADRIASRLLARKDRDATAASSFVAGLIALGDTGERAAAGALQAVTKAVSSGEAAGPVLAVLRAGLEKPLGAILSGSRESPLYFSALGIAAAWKDPGAIGEARKILLDPKEKAEWRSLSLDALFISGDATVLEAAAAILKDSASAPEALLGNVLLGLGKLEAPGVAEVILLHLAKLPPSMKPQAIDLLTQRPAWTAPLLGAVESKSIDSSSLNVNQIRRILTLKDEALSKRVGAIWGQVRAERNPGREAVIRAMRRTLEEKPGDAWAGKAVFDKTCLQCHVIFGKGNVVGPDITVNGRETLDALLSSLLDPNLVIGKGYQSWTLLTKSGRALLGLLVEDSPGRVVLRVAGGKDEIVPRDDVAALEASEISLMPEDLEKTLKPDEFRDLITYLRFEEAPPEPVETAVAGARPRAERSVQVSQAPGEAIVSARFGAGNPVEVLRFVHSNDQRPYIHPLRAPGGGPVLTALRPDDHPWQYGIFTGHARVNGVDFWHEKGWIRSRGLSSVAELDDRVEIVSRSDWLTERRAGKRILLEEIRLIIPAPAREDRFVIDFTWSLTPDEAVTFDQYEYGGLAFRPAEHEDRRHARAEGKEGQEWLDMSGKFGKGSEAVEAGVAIFDHPENPGHPSAWRADGQGLINPAITARGPLRLEAGKTAVFRYRLVVHLGHGDAKALDEEFRAWSEVAGR